MRKYCIDLLILHSTNECMESLEFPTPVGPLADLINDYYLWKQANFTHEHNGTL